MWGNSDNGPARVHRRMRRGPSSVEAQHRQGGLVRTSADPLVHAHGRSPVACRHTAPCNRRIAVVGQWPTRARRTRSRRRAIGRVCARTRMARSGGRTPERGGAEPDAAPSRSCERTIQFGRPIRKSPSTRRSRWRFRTQSDPSSKRAHGTLSPRRQAHRVDLRRPAAVIPDTLSRRSAAAAATAVHRPSVERPRPTMPPGPLRRFDFRAGRDELPATRRHDPDGCLHTHGA
jgi:hypothetical protein